jgi:ribose transport system permease protein
MIGMDHIASRAIREFRLRTIALRYSLLIVLLVVVVIFALSSPAFAVSTNVNTLLRAASIAAIMYVGATWVIASGEIDVSFMQVAAVSNMVVAAAVPHGWPMAIGLGIAIGFGIGLLNGVLVGLLRLPSLVITIMTGSLALSMAEAIGRGSSLSIADTGYVGYFVHFNLGAVPAVALLAAASYVLAWYLQERLVFGHYIYAVAQNRRAVVEAGIPARKIIVILFVISGVTSAIAGILLAAALASGQPRIGASYFLDGLTAISLGALVFRPSQANVLGTLAAVLLLATLVSGTALLGWSDWQQQTLKGALLLVSLVIVLWGRAADWG